MNTTDVETMENRAYSALAEHFLDTETRHLLPRTALACIRAGWSVERAKTAYFDEVAPSLWTNLLVVAGVWDGWDEASLIADCRSRRDRAVGGTGSVAGFVRRCVPFVSKLWASIERFIVRLERAEPAEREMLVEAFETLGRVYFDFCVGEISNVDPGARALASDAIRADFVEAITPVVFAHERKACERSFEVLRARCRNRDSTGLDLAPMLTDLGGWRAACGLPFDLPSTIASALVQAYASPMRAYHDLSHVVEVVRHLASAPLHDRVAPTLAALFHDAIHDPSTRESEARSAVFAENVLKNTPFASELPRVKELILLTAHHGSVSAGDVDPDAALFLDADMAILGASAERFDAYDRAIAAEHLSVPTRLYHHARRRFFERLLAREHIYLSEFFRARFEAPARASLLRAIGRRG